MYFSVKKILALTSIRSDYDLMSALYQRLNHDPDIELKLLVYGTHLSQKYGYSFQQIQQDGLTILAKLETLIDADSSAAQLKSASLLLLSAVDIVKTYAPDCLLYVGDREDVIMGGLLGAYLAIPTIHFWGGDHACDGNVDNLTRHATSKLSSIHMVALPEHKERLIALGEEPKRIFHIGDMALDHLLTQQRMSKAQIRDAFDISVGFETFALMIFHPFPCERQYYDNYFTTILQALAKNNISTFVSAPNSDPGNHRGFEVIDHYCREDNFHYIANLPRNLFYAIYRQANFIIGNSSSGIIEAASIPIPAINVGQRQLGRACGKNVIFCQPQLPAIDEAIQQAMSIDFRQRMSDMTNPYGDGHSSQKAWQLIKTLSFDEYLIKSADPLEDLTRESRRHCPAS